MEYQFFPKSSKIPDTIKKVADCFQECYDMIKTSSHQLISNDVLSILAPHFEKIGFNVETGKSKSQKIVVPVLFGKNGGTEKSFNVDALSGDGSIVIEVEAGRAFANNQFLKDIFEACLMHGVEYLVIAVCLKYKTSTVESNDFDKIYKFLETLYVSNRLELPLKGILLIGY